MTIIRWLHGGLAGALVSAGAALVVVIFARALGGLSLGWFAILLFMLAAGALGGLVQFLLVQAGGGAALLVVAPSGNTTPYTPTFSHIEAMVARGDLDAAAREFDAQCEAHPGNAVVWVKAADFDLRVRGEPKAARVRYEHVRNLPHVHADLARYACQKLIDLHLGPLGDEGRALVELRRFIERFPATREAEEAKAVLARLKESRRSG